MMKLHSSNHITDMALSVVVVGSSRPKIRFEAFDILNTGAKAQIRRWNYIFEPNHRHGVAHCYHPPVGGKKSGSKPSISLTLGHRSKWWDGTLQSVEPNHRHDVVHCHHPWVAAKNPGQKSSKSLTLGAWIQMIRWNRHSRTKPQSWHGSLPSSLSSRKKSRSKPSACLFLNPWHSGIDPTDEMELSSQSNQTTVMTWFIANHPWVAARNPGQKSSKSLTLGA